MIRQCRGAYTVELMCSALRVKPSGFYAWCKREPSERAKKDQEILTDIKVVHRRTRRSFGSPRVHLAIGEKHQCGRHRIARVMRENGIQAKPTKRFRRTTDSNHGFKVAANLLNRCFHAAEPDRVWVSDITCLWTREGWLYLAVTLDLFSRKVVGWATSRHIDTDLVLCSLRSALQTRRPRAGLIHHSDRGSQYASKEFQRVLRACGIIPSMSRKGDCWDNAVAESFFGSLKVEWLDDVVHDTRTQATRDVFAYIEAFYNSQRFHSTLGGLSPLQFEQAQAAKLCVH